MRSPRAQFTLVLCSAAVACSSSTSRDVGDASTPDGGAAGTDAGSAVSAKAFASPFGMHSAWVDVGGYAHGEEIGVHWDRKTAHLFWFVVQPALDREEFDWRPYDRVMQALPESMHMLMNIAIFPTIILSDLIPANTPDLERDRERVKRYHVDGSYLPKDEVAYRAFIAKAVDRYDGDGQDDMPGLRNPIRYWQVDNEPPQAHLVDYPEFLEITAAAIRAEDPEAKILIGGTTGRPEAKAIEYISYFNQVYLPYIEALKPTDFDVLDMHFYGNAITDYREFAPYVAHVRSALIANGFPATFPIWVTETCTYTGTPSTPVAMATQDERAQARDLVRRWISMGALRVEKIFWALGMAEGMFHDDNFFDYTGFIYDGWGDDDLGAGTKKLAYFTFRKMSETLDEPEWGSIETLRDSEGVHIYRVPLARTRDVYVAWLDEDVSGDVVDVSLEVGSGVANVRIIEAVPTSSVGRDIRAYESAFAEERAAVTNGRVDVAVHVTPVYVVAE